MKMLALGLHEDTPEGEARNAMKMAQKMLRKFNLSQAAVLSSHSEMENKASLKGLYSAYGFFCSYLDGPIDLGVSI